jgi:small subunit ribosomal protein S14
MARLAKIVASKKKPKFKVRQKNRCETCGRSRSFYRDFCLCRICLRKFALQGLLSGVTKSSW